MINPGVVAAMRVVDVRGDPCGAMRWTVQRIAPQGSPIIEFQTKFVEKIKTDFMLTI